MPNTIQAALREKSGKGPARAARRENQIPAVIYGDKQAPIAISLDARSFARELTPGFYTRVYQIETDGKKHKVLPRDVQRHPVTERVMHVDFLRVSDTTTMVVKVPILCLNAEKCPGIKTGGVLNMVYHELELRCKATNIPHAIAIDISSMKVGESVHLRDIKLPEGSVPLLHDANATLVSISAPSALKSKEGAAAAESKTDTPKKK